MKNCFPEESNNLDPAAVMGSSDCAWHSMATSVHTKIAKVNEAIPTPNAPIVATGDEEM